MRKVIALLAIVSILSILYFYFGIYASHGILDAFSPKYVELYEAQLQSLSHEQLVAMAGHAVSGHKELAAVANANISQFRSAVGILSVLLAIAIAVAWLATADGYKHSLNSKPQSGVN